MTEPYRAPHSRRYLGIELAGAKNAKTSIAAIEYYPKERKTFLLDIYERISAGDGKSGDEALLGAVRELGEGVSRVGVNVALDLPPCLTCTRKSCPLPAKCTVPTVRWMRETVRKAEKGARRQGKSREITPYTQRPFEIWARYHLLGGLPEGQRFEIDETMGGNRAPLTSRMHFLSRHLSQFEKVEVWPKLTVAQLGLQLGLSRRIMSSYRRLEEGAHARSEILEALVDQKDIFIYERDLKTLSTHLSTFDAFFCAYTALLSDLGQCAKIPKGFPAHTGWVQYPRPVWKNED